MSCDWFAGRSKLRLTGAILKAFVILKPDVSEEEAIDLINRLEQIGTIEYSDHRYLSRDIIELLYPEHVGRWYWERHVDHLTSGPSRMIGMDLPEGQDTMLELFKLDIRKGTTNPRNKIHTSENAERDIELFWGVHV
jgi:nucleoside diphosphate kinase